MNKSEKKPSKIRKWLENKKSNNNKNNGILNIIKEKIGNKRKETKKILLFLEEKKVKHLLLYTHCKNVLSQIEYGIFPIDEMLEQVQKEYIQWTYLEKEDHIELELDNSTRNYFWKWVADNNIEINDIAIIGFDLKKLFNFTQKDWTFNNSNHRVSIFEKILPECISWILIKNNFLFSYLKTYIENNNLNIKLFQSESGKIINNNLTEGEQEDE